MGWGAAEQCRIRPKMGQLDPFFGARGDQTSGRRVQAGRQGLDLADQERNAGLGGVASRLRQHLAGGRRLPPPHGQARHD